MVPFGSKRTMLVPHWYHGTTLVLARSTRQRVPAVPVVVRTLVPWYVHTNGIPCFLVHVTTVYYHGTRVLEYRLPTVALHFTFLYFELVVIILKRLRVHQAG